MRLSMKNHARKMLTKSTVYPINRMVGYPPEPFDPVCPEPFDPVRPEPVQGTDGAQGNLVECLRNKLIIINLIRTLFDRLTTNGLNQRFLSAILC